MNSADLTTCLIFNKEALIEDWERAKKPSWIFSNLSKWVIESDMTEKEAFPSYVTTGGYLKVFNSLKSAYIDFWDKTSNEEITLKELGREVVIIK